MVWIACLFSIVTGLLSVWQWHRLSWKQGIIGDMQEEYSKSPATTEDGLKEFRRVSFKGKWSHVPLFLQYKIRKGEIGCDIVLPFLHENGSVFLVNRGWQKECTTVEEEQSMEVQGIARSFLNSPQGTPSNVPPHEWYYMNADEMKNTFGIRFNEKYYIDRSNALPELPNNHLIYSLTWAVLSVIFLGIVFKLKKAITQ